VYLHETPHQTLFNADQRAFSSGCIRVENIRELAVLLFNNEVKWNRSAMEATLAEGKTLEINLPRKIPILIDYWTVDVEQDGFVSFRPDVYGRDYKLLQALDKAS
jgi:murein L,D-transpeptidase YcbB/YkuD